MSVLTIVESLGKKCDELNSLIEEINEAMRVQSYAVSAAIQLDANNALEWTKHGNVWQLVHTNRESSTPLTSATREARLRSVKFIEVLITELTKEQSRELSRVDTAIADATDVLANIRRGTAGT